VKPARKLWGRILLLIGSIGPLGHLPASGTVTVAVIGIPLFWLMHTWPAPVYVVVSLVFIAVAIWIHHLGDALLGEKDSRKLVWDELAGFMVAVAFMPFTWRLALLAFLLERAIDIVKVPPANWIEKHWPGGWGVVGDDLVAGLYTLVILHAAIHFIPGWVGVAA
jgi:phosphatidylglycerophosphatase A